MLLQIEDPCSSLQVSPAVCRPMYGVYFFAFFRFFLLNFRFTSIFSLNFRLFFLRFRFRFLVFHIEVNHVKSGFFFASKRNEIFASFSNFASEAKVRAHPSSHLWLMVLDQVQDPDHQHCFQQNRPYPIHFLIPNKTEWKYLPCSFRWRLWLSWWSCAARCTRTWTTSASLFSMATSPGPGIFNRITYLILVGWFSMA